VKKWHFQGVLPSLRSCMLTRIVVDLRRFPLVEHFGAECLTRWRRRSANCLAPLTTHITNAGTDVSGHVAITARHRLFVDRLDGRGRLATETPLALREGCQHSVSSCCGEVVGVKETAESVASLELLDGGERGWWRRWLDRDGWAAAERSVL
jgi:hypothetical protein